MNRPYRYPKVQGEFWEFNGANVGSFRPIGASELFLIPIFLLKSEGLSLLTILAS